MEIPQRQRRTTRRGHGRIAGLATGTAPALLAVLPAYADGGGPGEHGAATGAFDSGAMLWGALALGGVLLAILVSRAVLARQRSGLTGPHSERVGYLEAYLYYAFFHRMEEASVQPVSAPASRRVRARPSRCPHSTL